MLIKNSVFHFIVRGLNFIAKEKAFSMIKRHKQCNF